jgi:hypothetical protein
LKDARATRSRGGKSMTVTPTLFIAMQRRHHPMNQILAHQVPILRETSE